MSKQNEQYDIVITGGRVMDPESGLDAVRNVGIKNEKIDVITDKPIQGKETIDAAGHVVAPGFIDLHAHGQGPFDIKTRLRDGVTSPLEIEAGAYPVEVFYKEREGKAQANYAASIGHVWARMAALDGIDPKGLGMYSGAMNACVADGSQWHEKNTDDPKDLERIMANIEEGLKQGGVGIGVPVGYFNKCSSAELEDVFALAKRHNTFVSSHVRYMSNIQPSGVLGVLEVIALAYTYDVPLLIHHIHSTSLHRTKEALAIVDAAQKRGLNVIAEAYPYDFGSSVIGADYLGEGFQQSMLMDYSDITYVKTGEKMTKELLAKYRKEDPGGFMMMHHMRMEDVDVTMQHEGVIVGSDAMGFADANGKPLEWDDAPGKGVAHPRGAGCYAKTLRLVRERNYMPLMTAISKMSYLTARWLEDFVPAMKQLGRLKPGATADIAVFNPDTVTDNAVAETGKFALPSTGIPYVIVNGTIVVKDSEVLKVYPGRAIKGGN
jgi:cytosine/adenosine deaminase-related metal-dependent hydrolase